MKTIYKTIICLIILTGLNQGSTAQTQKGIDMDGEAAIDWSGYSVSMPDANTMAIGAVRNDGNGTDVGHVRVYTWNGSAWVQKGIDMDGEVAGNNSGRSVSMPDSNTVAIGALKNDGNGIDAGHVRVYSWNGSAWVQKGIDMDGEAANDYSGWSVSMPDANTVAIGATRNDGNGSNAGHVRVYTWNGSAWVQKGIDIDGEAANDQSGYSVSMPDSNTVAIGAPYNGGNGTDAGHVRVYSWNGSAWVQKGIDMDGEAASDWSGWSVSMPDANTVAIGALYNDGNGTDAGHVRVYDFCIGNNTAGTISPTSCFTYTSPSGNHTWTASGTYMDTIPNTAGCDSVITVNLTINTVDVSVTNTSPTVTANATGAAYQWLDCNNTFAVISGATNQNFTATTNGSYAVEVTENGCTDTSACETVNNVSIIENSFGSNLLVFPNPTNGKLTIDLGANYNDVFVIVRNALGQEVFNKSFSSSNLIQFDIPGETGIYFVEVMAEDKRALLKVIKE